MKRVVRLVVAVLGAAAILVVVRPAHAAAPEAEIIDMFGRTINGYGVKLVDWQGYLTNPYTQPPCVHRRMSRSRSPSTSRPKARPD